MASVTIQDVADHAGVSMKTVSRVVNRDANVRLTTREKVQKSVQALGYRPNRFARSLAGRKSYLIGLLYDNPSPAYVLAIQEGALQKCEEEGYGLLIHHANNLGDALVDDVLSLVRHSQVDGLILTPPFSDKAVLIDALDAHRIEFCRVSPAKQHWTSSVVATESNAVKELVSYLVTLGHKDIGFIIGHPDHGASTWRLAGFKEAMSEANLVINPVFVQQGDFSFESGERCARIILEGDVRPTAIFASNDYMAAGVMKVAQQMGFSIPDDIAIAGFDDAPVASQLWPSLTTIKQPVSEIAARVAELLIDQIAGRPAVANTDALVCELVIRGSTGPHAA